MPVISGRRREHQHCLHDRKRSSTRCDLFSGHILTATFGLMIGYPSMPWRMRCLADNDTPYYVVRHARGELLFIFCIV